MACGHEVQVDQQWRSRELPLVEGRLRAKKNPMKTRCIHGLGGLALVGPEHPFFLEQTVGDVFDALRDLGRNRHLAVRHAAYRGLGNAQRISCPALGFHPFAEIGEGLHEHSLAPNARLRKSHLALNVSTVVASRMATWQKTCSNKGLTP